MLDGKIGEMQFILAMICWRGRCVLLFFNLKAKNILL